MCAPGPASRGRSPSALFAVPFCPLRVLPRRFALLAALVRSGAARPPPASRARSGVFALAPFRRSPGPGLVPPAAAPALARCARCALRGLASSLALALPALCCGLPSLRFGRPCPVWARPWAWLLGRLPLGPPASRRWARSAPPRAARGPLARFLSASRPGAFFGASFAAASVVVWFGALRPAGRCVGALLAAWARRAFSPAALRIRATLRLTRWSLACLVRPHRWLAQARASASVVARFSPAPLPSPPPPLGAPGKRGAHLGGLRPPPLRGGSPGERCPGASRQPCRSPIVAAAVKGQAGQRVKRCAFRPLPLTLPLREMRRRGLTFSNICAIMTGPGSFGCVALHLFRVSVSG